MTDINITQSNTILTNNKSMTDDKFVDEVEEGVITDSNKTKMPPPKTRKTRLSVVSQQYDINKDGVLDEAELASTLLVISFSCVSPIPHRHLSHMSSLHFGVN